MKLSKQTRQYIDSLKYKNEYCLYEDEVPYKSNPWSESGYIMLDDEKWMFYMREKCSRSMGFDPVWGLINEKDEIIQLKSSELDLLLGEHGEKLSINEKFEELTRGIFATNSGYDVKNRMTNKAAPYRMIWDNNIKYYFIGDAYDFIHDDILEHAYYSGFYPEMLSANDCRDYMDKNMTTKDMILFAFEPEGGGFIDQAKSSDGYTRKYVYKFGTIYSHEFTPFENCPLYELLGEPVKKETIYEALIKTKEPKMDFSKLNKVIQPKNVIFWNDLMEDMGALGAAPCPALGQSGTAAGCTVNGIPVAGKSVKYNKKKTKKSKKNEGVQWIDSDGVEHIEDFSKSNLSAELDAIDRQEHINKLEKTGWLESPKELFKKFKGSTDDRDFEDAINILLYGSGQDDIDEYNELCATFAETDRYDDFLRFAKEKYGLYGTALDSYSIGKHLEEHVVNQDMEDLINDLLNEDFNEAYERITDLIAKQLDKMNFEFANTDEIIYKKEGEYKYLFKFDNELGIIKIKVLKGKEVLVEKEWTLDEEDDVSPVFEEIEEIYGRYGL